jgi:hypothetical protein
LYNKEKLLENGDKWEAEIAKSIEADYLCIPNLKPFANDRSLNDLAQKIDRYKAHIVSCKQNVICKGK